ncbi:hypothetical protein DFH11DRAFT_1880255 [Phellopilus nigrolimitatus]|nr:hypothetical protein DFH11DRAFT_1880255 [Phellopilus nigrolimitatus]
MRWRTPTGLRISNSSQNGPTHVVPVPASSLASPLSTLPRGSGTSTLLHEGPHARKATQACHEGHVRTAMMMGTECDDGARVGAAQIGPAATDHTHKRMNRVRRSLGSPHGGGCAVWNMIYVLIRIAAAAADLRSLAANSCQPPRLQKITAAAADQSTT